MEVDKLVTVYGFAVLDGTSGQRHPSRYKAPRALIEGHFEGVVLEGTAELVDAEALDEKGRYRRIATGWGELN